VLPLPPPRKRGFVSKAVRLLREAPTSPCAACGRDTKTTSDGVCADCWAHKDGGHYGSVPPPPRWVARLAGLLSFRRP